MLVARRELGRRIAFLIAAKSYNRPLVGLLARATGALPVARAMDNMKPGQGTIKLADPMHNPSLIRGIGTNFLEYHPHDTLTLPAVNGVVNTGEIAEIKSAEELILRKPFKNENAIKQLTGVDSIKVNENGDYEGSVSPEELENYEGIKFKHAQHVDQTKVYNAVFETLENNGCVGIFPEGGSHDRPNLLPLKAGVALMALGALAKNPDCGVKIIPVGMNYFHAHKFRSRAVIEFGSPVEVPPELVEKYKNNQRREAVGELLDTIYQALVAVTVTSPDYETLMVIQAARRLYNPTGKKVPLPMVVELNRRLVNGYKHYQNDPRILDLKNQVMDYNRQLRLLGIRDHQVQHAKFSIVRVVAVLVYRFAKLLIMSIGTLPGLALFGPVFILAKVISVKKSREAVAASSVKIQGRDVMSTWKLLVALAFAPLLYAFYTAILTYWTWRNRVWGQVPEWVPLWSIIPFGFWFFPSVTYAALRIGEIGMDILKSLPPLVLSLNPTSANTLYRLRQRREQLSEHVTQLINTLGPELYPDFNHMRIVGDPLRDTLFENAHGDDAEDIDYDDSGRAENRHGRRSSSSSRHLPRNESFPELGKFGFFSTQPPSRTQSRSSSQMSRRSRTPSQSLGGTADWLKPLSTSANVNSKSELDEVSRRIHGAMRERGEVRRRRQSLAEADDDEGRSGSEGSDDESDSEGPMMHRKAI
ncbi:glycerol-3-phosphate O-acyltransferase [Ascosphaera apis ARSEF 7405]|uniref:Glycerol-3-phosphate O-acyltransferase n=1 Tax=Ascosphaera apis ARSEF 7405 TaxID=392613 RepID=A0A168A9N3_9EURO|nr:glycerol-3-phosphate O-acyltransferase [Ascosphaera apis ARSEF 7405]